MAFHFGFFNRINADIELYHKKTTNMLMSVPQSYVNNGFGMRWANVGAMINTGAEISLSFDVLRVNDFAWNINANASYNYNEITELYNGLDEYEMSGTSTKLRVGRSVGEFFINRYAGVNPANGDALWLDKDGNITNEFREEDKVYVGKNFNAPWQGGFGTTLAYKGVSLSANFSWVADRWMINNDRYFDESNGRFATYNQSRRLLNRWKKPGDVTDIPRHGVYLTRCTVDDKQVFGLTNVGLRPTVDKNAAVNCETFLLDFSGDLYDSSMRVEFLEFLRPEIKFASEEALYEQIHRDLAAARDRISHDSKSNV
jgi:hypothetical protein